MKPLLRPDGNYDRAAIVVGANRLFAYMRAKGAEDWPRKRCLSFFWAQARIRRAEFLGVALAPPKKRKPPQLRAPRRAGPPTIRPARRRAGALHSLPAN
ncbi:hypothetical protein [Methylocystis parvus]|uniref:hypothetical protein n=1 Tax=Methylocystis parvus TaxID=134 RepID=UPI003C714AB8